MHFGIWFYFSDKRDFSELDLFFHSVFEKILLYQRHCTYTDDLYTKELKEKKLILKDEEDVKYKVANEKYISLLAKIDSSDENDDINSLQGDAYYQSGIEDIMYEFREENEILDHHFKEMRDYFNKSSLVLLFGMMESELRRLCALLRIKCSKRIALKDLSERNYLDSLFNYLDLVVELPIDKLKLTYADKFKTLQFLRNKIMHNGGLFDNIDKNDELLEIITKSSGTLKLENEANLDSEILRIQDISFIHEYYKFANSFFSDLLLLIEHKLNYQIFNNRLTHLFKYLEKELMATVETVNELKKARVFISKIEYIENGTIKNLKCNIKIEKSKSNKLQIVNQIPDGSMPKRLKDLLKHFHDYPQTVTDNAFGLFLNPDYSKITLMIYPGN